MRLIKTIVFGFVAFHSLSILSELRAELRGIHWGACPLIVEDDFQVADLIINDGLQADASQASSSLDGMLVLFPELIPLDFLQPRVPLPEPFEFPEWEHDTENGELIPQEQRCEALDVVEEQDGNFIVNSDYRRYRLKNGDMSECVLVRSRTDRLVRCDAPGGDRDKIRIRFEETEEVYEPGNHFMLLIRTRFQAYHDALNTLHVCKTCPTGRKRNNNQECEYHTIWSEREEVFFQEEVRYEACPDERRELQFHQFVEYEYKAPRRRPLCEGGSPEKVFRGGSWWSRTLTPFRVCDELPLDYDPWVDDQQQF